MLTLQYGTVDKYIDITSIVMEKCVSQKIAYIPSGDNSRAALFTDPAFGVVKHILIDDGSVKTVYDSSKAIYIDIQTNAVYINNLPDSLVDLSPLTKAMKTAKNLHSTLKLDFGSFEDEYPEQLMAIRYLKGDERVLELGGNIGRNSLIIASILNSKGNNNFVSLESDTNISKQLIHNRDLNSLDFFVENAALSNRNLIQQGWITVVSDVLKPGYKKINTITLEGLYVKYGIRFDTLILDCEGAFYYILMDMPEILNNVNLIIMENDYLDLTHKEYIDSVLKENGFYVDYSEAGGWGPCQPRFFEVWKR
jgi:FkbM family methyltransferase